MSGRQWWPNTRLPDGTGPWPQSGDESGSSGSISAAADAPLTNARLCGAVLKRSPMVLEIAVSTAGLSAESIGPSFELFAAAENNTIYGTGYITVEYGAAGTTQSVRLDLRGGSYQLPPCEEVRVTVTTAVQATFLPALNIVGSIVPGVHPSPTVPTYTWRDEVLASGVSNNVMVPPRARTVDCWVSNDDPTVPIYGSGAPVLCLAGDVMCAQVIRDYALGVWAPPYPCPMVMHTDLDTSIYKLIAIASDVACVAIVQFELQL